MRKAVYLDLHVLQSVPPNCLNRDDTGSPKTAIYGGARRARVSSQSWKRSIRLMFRENFDESALGVRTKSVFDYVVDAIIAQRPSVSRDDALASAKKVLEMVKVKPQKKGDADKLDALFFIGHQEAKNLAAIALGDIDGKSPEAKEIMGTLKSKMAVDIALFGRMVASNPLLNSDACAQVAHAISTHRVENEYDYFTAVDDLASEDNAGAAHLDTVEYNSATYYRYATVAAHCLFDLLVGECEALEQALREFTRAFVCSMPTGKQNTFAANTMPDAVLASIRLDRPLNLVGAFETPVRAEGFVAASARALEQYAQSIYGDFCIEPAKSYVVGPYFKGLGERVSLDQLLNSIGEDIAGMVQR